MKSSETLLRLGNTAAALFFAALLAACSSDAPPPQSEVRAASEARVRLMSTEQYRNSIAQTFGSDIAASVIPPLPPLPRSDGLLASSAAFVGLTSDQVSQIQQAAATIAARVVDREHRLYLLPCQPSDATVANSECAAAFLRETGRLLYKRPLSTRQLEALTRIADHAADNTGDFYSGLALALEAMLVSPEFLFIVDRTEPDPGNPGTERLDAYSLASRLSFFLWNSPPDDALLRAAETGALHTEAGLERAVTMLLESTRLEHGVRAFFDDMLAFDEFDSLAKDPLVYPMVTAATLRDAREQTLRTLVHHLITEEADYRDIFTTRETFISMPLAAIYNTPADEGWSAHEFSESDPRPGLLTQVSFLAANSHSVRSSPTLRGKAMRELLLCQHVPDPPPNVDFSTLEDAGDVATARERLKVHNTNPSCAGCHLITDPMGLALENFDGAGAFRETENGAELDISGELDGVFFDDIDGLASAMRNHPKLASCLVNRLYAYGTGGPVSLRRDRDILANFEQQFVADGHRLPGLLREISTSAAFSSIRSAEPGQERVSVSEQAIEQRAQLINQQLSRSSAEASR